MNVNRDARHSNRYATADDFQKYFAREMQDLFHLALLLTADCEHAECCIILAMKDCFNNSSVTAEWIPVWARRTIVRHAVKLLSPKYSPDFRESTDQCNPHAGSGANHFLDDSLMDSLAIISLPCFERLVFVICEIERYCIQDCALLMGKSPKDVSDALNRSRCLIGSCELQDRDFCRQTMQRSPDRTPLDAA
jgi:hypothetical protein